MLVFFGDEIVDIVSIGHEFSFLIKLLPDEELEVDFEFVDPSPQ